MARKTRGAAPRMEAVQDPIIPIVGDWIRAHPGTISLGQGVVHYGPPPEALEATAAYIHDPRAHRYASVDGIPPLREALAAKLRAENGLPLTEEGRIVVTAGANMGFVNALLAITEPGDEVILPAPYYFNHDMAITMLGARTVAVPTDDAYQLDPERIRAALTPRTRAVVTVSPNNPSGAVYAPETLAAVNALCAEHGIYHISDEAYEYFTYGAARHRSPGALEGAEAHTISLYSLSKAYGFAGWRIGYMAIPRALERAVQKAQDTILICAPLVSQAAALAVLDVGAGYCRRYLPGLDAVRREALDQLAALAPFGRVPTADGAFYLLLHLDTDRDPLDIVHDLIREHGVAVIPGTTFGVHDRCTLRIAYGALQPETVAEGIGRLVTGLTALANRP